MKKIIAVLMAACMIFSMAACGTSKTDSSSSSENEAAGSVSTANDANDSSEANEAAKSDSSTETAASSSDAESLTSASDFEVTKKDGKVYLTMPADSFNGQTEDQIKSSAKELGYSDATVNKDGSVTYTMTEKKHEEKLEKIKEQIDVTTESALEGENAVDSFLNVDYNDDYSLFTITVDKSKYSEDAALSHLWLYYVLGSRYRSFYGISNNNEEVVVKVVDKSGNVISSKNYAQFMKEHNLE